MKTVNEVGTLILTLLVGAMIGGLFFGGLWWTIRQAALSKIPALWFMGSGLVRMSGALAGFFWISHGRFERLVAAVLGFFFARWAVRRLVAPKKPASLSVRGDHAY